MGPIICLAYGAVAYLAFFASILYAIGFVGNVVVPKSIDSGVPGPVGTAIIVNFVLLALFAIQHTIMARPAFRARWTRVIPPATERSTFVLIASLLLLLIMWQWRPMVGTIWAVDQPVVRAMLIAISLVGWATVFYSSFVIDHFDLFGLRQVYLHLRGRDYTHSPFKERSLYKYIRHPLMAGFLIAFWATPTMTQGHLLFVVVITAYIFFGTAMEERDLLRILGEDYARYRRRTPMILPFPRLRAPRPAARQDSA